MRQYLKYLVAFSFPLAESSSASVGPWEDIAQLMQQLDQTCNEGNLDAYMAPYAENAVFAPPNVPFRIEGKDALWAYYAGVMETFPTHRVSPRQTTIQIYDGRTAVESRYDHAVFVDRNSGATPRLVSRSVRRTPSVSSEFPAPAPYRCCG